MAGPAAGGKRKMVFRGLPRACWEFSCFPSSRPVRAVTQHMAAEGPINGGWTQAAASDVGGAEFREPVEVHASGCGKEWALGIRLYFFNEAQVAQSAEGEYDPVIEFWLDMGAEVVVDKQACTHLVLDHVEVGHAQRDCRAREDICWAERNNIGDACYVKKIVLGAARGS